MASVLPNVQAAYASSPGFMQIIDRPGGHLRRKCRDPGPSKTPALLDRTDALRSVPLSPSLQGLLQTGCLFGHRAYFRDHTRFGSIPTSQLHRPRRIDHVGPRRSLPLEGPSLPRALPLKGNLRMTRSRVSRCYGSSFTVIVPLRRSPGLV